MVVNSLLFYHFSSCVSAAEKESPGMSFFNIYLVISTAVLLRSQIHNFLDPVLFDG